MKHLVSTFVLTISFSAFLFSQSVLSVGDIAIIAVESTNPDDFAFVALNSWEAGTEIYFTDKGFDSEGVLYSGEGYYLYTSPTSVSPGTVIKFSSHVGDFVKSGSFALSNSGDQLIAFQIVGTDTNYLHGVNIASKTWSYNSNYATNTSCCPCGLCNDSTCVAVGKDSSATTEWDNCYYQGSKTLDATTTFLEINDDSNWLGVNTTKDTILEDSFPLPVELVGFTARISNNKVILNWETVSEINNYGFDIERSSYLHSSFSNSNTKSRLLFEKIGFVEGNGNSNSSKYYSFVDDNPMKSNAIYRLKQIDFDGKYEYSAEIEVNYKVVYEFALSQNYPNPFNPKTNISFKLAERGKVSIKIFNAIGQEVAELVNKPMEAGKHEVTFNASNLPSGAYFCRMTAGNFTKTSKMLLIK